MRIALVVGALAFPLFAAEPNSAKIDYFEKHVRPILVEQCESCHGEKKQSGGLRLDSKAATLKGGDTGPALVPGKPNESILLKAVNHQGELKMPPKGKLPASSIAALEKWIADGAIDPRDGKSATTEIDWNKAREFWAFKPVVMPSVPAGTQESPIDRFIAAKIREQGLSTAPLADKRALIRRVTFDLTGLPPTPTEVQAFLSDDSPKAYAKLVDRLLASTAYGEMQARQWLDVARYAEDQAHTFGVKPNSEAWRYRDWVIQSFNDDLPYDRFVKYQIAADQLLGDSPEEVRHRAALGFFGLGAVYYKNSDAAKAAADELDDRVDTLTRGLLGLTVSCARCHDHKFDPIPTQDYYSLAGVFSSSKLASIPLAPKAEVERVNAANKALADLDKKAKDLLQSERNRLTGERAEQLPRYVLAAWSLEAERLKKPDTSADTVAKKESLDGPTLDRLTRYLGRKGVSTAMNDWGKRLPKKEGPATPPDEIKKMADAFKVEVKSAIAKPMGKAGEMVQALFGEKGVFPLPDAEVAKQMPMNKKADYDQAREKHAELAKKAPAPVPTAHGIDEANAADMKVFVRGNPAKPGEVAPRRFLRIVAGDSAPKFSKGSGRRELAEAIADPKNPLTARVFVNRIWQQHFGRGIVGTPSNFGNLGERPTHPELLDWLAATFVAEGWSVKSLHRHILLSETYRRSSESNTASEEKDADNRYLWRANRRRLSVESWRDAMLAVSGRLDRTMGGQTTNLDAPDNVRRTVYARISRHELNQLLRLFDFPDANITSERRVETTVPQQQLFILNSQFAVNQAKALAVRLDTESKSDAERVARAYELVFGRPATNGEIELGVKFLTGPAQSGAKLSRREQYCQALLASNEFLYVD